MLGQSIDAEARFEPVCIRSILSSINIKLMNVIPCLVCRPLAVCIMHFCPEMKRLLTKSQAKPFKSIRHLPLRNSNSIITIGLMDRQLISPGANAEGSVNSFLSGVNHSSG